MSRNEKNTSREVFRLIKITVELCQTERVSRMFFKKFDNLKNIM